MTTTTTTTIEQQLARLARDIFEAPGSSETAVRDRNLGDIRIADDVEQRVQPIARSLADRLCADAADREHDQDQVVLALELVMDRLLNEGRRAGVRRSPESRVKLQV